MFLCVKTEKKKKILKVVIKKKYNYRVKTLKFKRFGKKVFFFFWFICYASGEFKKIYKETKEKLYT